LGLERVSSVVQEDIRPVGRETAEFATVGQLEELYLRFGPGGLRLAYLLIGDHQAAEDCVQEAFARVIARLGHVRTGQAFDAYLRRTIVNLAKNGWRKSSTERAKAFAGTPPTQVAPAADADVVDRLTMFQAIQALPIRQRTAIVLRFYEDLPEADIAAVMRCRPGTARSLISRGMAALRSELERYTDA
jgi:RNA polymerase sigma-70 factor (sigma-E family)